MWECLNHFTEQGGTNVSTNKRNTVKLPNNGDKSKL